MDIKIWGGPVYCCEPFYIACAGRYFRVETGCGGPCNGPVVSLDRNPKTEGVIELKVLDPSLWEEVWDLCSEWDLCFEADDDEEEERRLQEILFNEDNWRDHDHGR